MHFVEIRRSSGQRAAQAIEQQAASETQPPLQDAKTPSPVSEISKAVLDEIIKAVETQMVQVGRVGVGIRRALVRRYDDDLCSRLGNPVHFRHGPQDVRLVLKEMRKANSLRAVVADGPGEMHELAKHIRRRTRLAIQPDRSGLLLLPASDVEDEHGFKRAG